MKLPRLRSLGKFLVLSVVFLLTLCYSPFPSLAQSEDAIANNTPVVLDNRTLFTLPDQSHAENISEQLTKIANDETITLDRLRLENEEDETNFYAGNQLIFTLTDEDISTTSRSSSAVEIS
ncbi:MAG: hypothetical protein F6K03_18355, partial [Kamptonema sp. SIO4C4]|nr:hypothetical protein [Kamptonema sp. SIO4C4]